MHAYECIDAFERVGMGQWGALRTLQQEAFQGVMHIAVVVASSGVETGASLPTKDDNTAASYLYPARNAV